LEKKRFFETELNDAMADIKAEPAGVNSFV